MTNNEQTLSQEPRQAMQDMLTITEELMARIEMETAALAQNDGTAFSMNEVDKEHVSGIYDKAAAEFHGRLAEFQNVDSALMEKLQTANAELRQSMSNNVRLLEKVEAKNQKAGA